jgi:hypothetical protein
MVCLSLPREKRGSPIMGGRLGHAQKKRSDLQDRKPAQE